MLDEAHEYINGLENSLGKPMYTTHGITGFVEFLVAVVASSPIFFNVIENTPMNYIQQTTLQLELFFGPTGCYHIKI